MYVCVYLFIGGCSPVRWASCWGRLLLQSRSATSWHRLGVVPGSLTSHPSHRGEGADISPAHTGKCLITGLLKSYAKWL